MYNYLFTCHKKDKSYLFNSKEEAEKFLGFYVLNYIEENDGCLPIPDDDYSFEKIGGIVDFKNAMEDYREEE